MGVIGDIGGLVLGTGQAIAGGVRSRRNRRDVNASLPPEYLEESAYDNYEEYAPLKDAMSKLQQLSSGGYTEGDRASLNSAMMQSAQEDRARRQGMQDSYQRTGRGGSGARIAGDMASIQSGADVRGQQANAQAVEAQRRAIQALRDQTQLGLNIADAKATAKDRMLMYNNQLKNAYQSRKTNMALNELGANSLYAQRGLDKALTSGSGLMDKWLDEYNKKKSAKTTAPATR